MKNTNTFTLKNLERKLSIEMPENFIVNNGENVIGIMFPNNFDWMEHAKTCVDCKNLLETMLSGKDEIWEINLDGKTRILNLVQDFDTEKNYHTNLLSKKISNYTIVKFKFEVREAVELLKEYEEKERYELCKILKSQYIDVLENK